MGVGMTEMTTSTIIKSENVGWKGEEPTDIVKKAISEQLIKPGDKLLDIGCGFGRNAIGSAKEGAIVTAININNQELVDAKAKARALGISVDFQQADATNLPFAEASFDCALDLGCSHMIPTQEMQEKAAKEAARVIKHGGTLIYFGFSKEHPSYQRNPKPMYRDLVDIQAMYGNDFDIISHEEVSWKPLPEEHANFSEHIGLNIIMRRK
jgi:ubiquinone/menaquinone biosynthesis C-methylase UbiE